MADNNYDENRNEDLPPVDAYEDMQIPDDDMNEYDSYHYNNTLEEEAPYQEEAPQQEEAPKQAGIPNILFVNKEMDNDAEELNELEQNNGINIDDNRATPELKDSIGSQAPSVGEEMALEPNFKLSERDYDSLDYFSSFRGDNLAVSDGEKINQYIKSEGLVDHVDSLKDMSQEEKDSLKELIYQESEPVSGQLGFPKDRLYEEIGDKKFGVNKNLNPDGSEIVHDKDNLSEDGKSKEAKNEEADAHDPYEKPDPNQNHPSYILQTIWNSYHNKRNLHNTKVNEKSVTPKSVQDMSLAEQVNHFDKMNRDMDYMKKQMEKYEENAKKHQEMTEDFDTNKESLTPEQSKIQQDKIKELNSNNNKQRVAVEKQMDDMSVKMDDISMNHDPMKQSKGKSVHDKKAIEQMSKTMKETRKRTAELSEISTRLEDNNLVNPKKSSGFKNSLKNIGDKIEDITQSITNSISKVFSR
jgi:hypothetical protein